MPPRPRTRKPAAPAPVGDATRDFESLLRRSRPRGRYVLKLYVTGTTLRSAEAIANVRSLCDEHLAGRYDLEVIDIYQQPGQAAGAQILAAPTLVKSLPAPAKRLIGNLSDREKVLVALDVSDAEAGAPRTRWLAL